MMQKSVSEGKGSCNIVITIYTLFLVRYCYKNKCSDYFGTSLMEFIFNKLTGPKPVTWVGVNTYFGQFWELLEFETT